MNITKPITKSDILSKIKVDPVTLCWIWSGTITTGGYGRLRRYRKEVKAHRASFCVFVRELSNEEFVLHKCDETRCVNPDHLFIGTQKDNVLDMAKKNRGRTSKSGLPYGVSALGKGKTKRYKSRISVAGEKVYIGCFDTAEEARSAAESLKMEVYKAEV